MKIKDGFSLKTIDNRSYILNETEEQPKLYYLNETGVFLWDLLAVGCDAEQLKKRIMEVYQIEEEEIVWKDIKDFLTMLKQIGVLEE